MRLSLLCIFLFLLFGCQQPKKDSPKPVQVSYGHIERLPDFQSKYIKERNVDILLPPNYDENRTYPVLYMQDGQMLFDSTHTWNKQEWGVDETLSRLTKNNIIPETIVVGIWNGDKYRHSEYFPQVPFEMLPTKVQDSLITGAKRSNDQALFASPIQSDKYLKFLVEELKPYIDKKFSTKTRSDFTSIAGSSMGGLISMYAICEYPQIFGQAACISTHWIGTMNSDNNIIPSLFVQYLKTHLPDPSTHKIYFDYGTETLDALYEPFQLKVDSVMIKKGFTSDDWMTKKFEGHDHSERSWNNRLHIPFTFVLK